LLDEGQKVVEDYSEWGSEFIPRVSPEGFTPRYASIGGKPNPAQPELIRAAAARMRAGSEITAAMDADAAGRELAQVVKRAVEMSGRADLKFRIHEPSGHKDFSDQLRVKPTPLHPCRPEEPSVA
jgi:hypothetical protein